MTGVLIKRKTWTQRQTGTQRKCHGKMKAEIRVPTNHQELGGGMEQILLQSLQKEPIC